ncbi:metalloproteinase inhibitor 1-like [Lytechinus variegatus]|uniref:metalloproteinase inhibitor 1-like n=1 Tax=Lytechinus variegatus TaxID=7654 RepID=UPI001BB170A0|nr:metalloproteinase inhibitor 1-like [Lytechinus variegatus]
MAVLASPRIYVCFIIVLLGLINISLVSASCASCPITHPQQKFCQSTFVFKVRTISMQYVNSNKEAVLYASQAYDVQYKVKVENVFKGEDQIGKEGQTVFIYSPKNVCNIDKLEMGIRYLISGNMKGDKMEVTTCGIVEKWTKLSPSQRRGVRGFYQSQCSGCKVYGTSIQRLFGKDAMDPMSSGLWSRQRCFFNPIASLTHGSEDCETKYAYCMRQENGVCTWEGGNAYDKCFQEREYNWQLMKFGQIGLAAWTCPEQCKNLTTRKLRFKCKKATRKMPPCNSGDTVREFTPNAVRTVVPEMPEERTTVQPNSLQENPVTVNPNVIQEVPASRSSTVSGVLSAMLHED